jgi:hypothetical protein
MKKSRNVIEIYKEYEVMPNLQDHMLRVAAVAFLICDGFNEPIEKEEIISACLLHDMGNIIKFNLEHFPESLEPKGLDYWTKIKEKYIEKYGKDDHVATKIIAKEIGVSNNIIELIEYVGFFKATINEFEKLFKYKICNYSDMRVCPYGVLSLRERISEAHGRYKDRKHSISSDSFESLSLSFHNMEKQIFLKCKIKPEDINNETISSVVLELKNYMIK